MRALPISSARVGNANANASDGSTTNKLARQHLVHRAQRTEHTAHIDVHRACSMP
jgi:hypothetical protein